MSVNRRLAVLEERRRRQPPPRPPTPFDSSRLTMRQQAELDTLLAHLVPLPGEHWALEELTTEELERMNELVRKAHGLAPEAPYPYMRHRDADIGPCRCAGDRCGKAVTP